MVSAHDRDEPRPRHVGAVDDFIVETQSRGRLTFSLSEIASGVPTAGRALEAALRRRADAGAIVRIAPRTGFFLIVPPEHRTMGAPPVEAWIDDLMGHLGRSYYVGLLSAAERRGSSHFAVMTTQVVASKWMRPIRVGRIRVRFLQSNSAEAMPVEVEQGLWGPMRVAWPETVAVDLLRHRVCGVDRTALILSDLGPSMSTVRMRRALDAGGDVPTAQRLGFVLERIGCQRMADAVGRWIAGAPIRTIDLVPGYPATDEAMDMRWRVRGAIPDGILGC